MTDVPNTPAPPRLSTAGSRKLTLQVTLEIAGSVPLASGYIVSALADALPEVDRQGLLFPGITWPRPGERLLDWSVTLIGVGGGAPDRVERVMEALRRDGSPPPLQRPRFPTDLRDQAEALAALIEDLDPLLVSRAEAAWASVQALRHAAAMLETPGMTKARAVAAIAFADRAVSEARSQLGVVREGETPVVEGESAASGSSI